MDQILGLFDADELRRKPQLLDERRRRCKAVCCRHDQSKILVVVGYWKVIIRSEMHAGAVQLRMLKVDFVRQLLWGVQQPRLGASWRMLQLPIEEMALRSYAAEMVQDSIPWTGFGDLQRDVGLSRRPSPTLLSQPVDSLAFWS